MHERCNIQYKLVQVWKGFSKRGTKMIFLQTILQLLILSWSSCIFLPGLHLFKLGKENTRTMCKICLRSTIKILRSGSLNLNKFHALFFTHFAHWVFTGSRHIRKICLLINISWYEVFPEKNCLFKVTSKMSRKI